MAHVKPTSERSRESGKTNEEELRLRRVIDTIPALVWCNLPDGSNEFLSKSWHEYTGLAPEEAHGWGWQSAFHPEDLPPLMEKWRELLISGQHGEIEARLRRTDGVYRWFLIRVEPCCDETGNVQRWYGTSTDIEDRKLAEEQLRRGEAFLVEGQRLSRTGTFSWRLKTGEIRWSEELYRIFDFAPDQPVTLELIASRVHPDDLPMMGEMIERAKRGDDQFEYEHRIVMPGGSTKYIHLIGHAVRDAEGHVEYFGAAHDITQRRIAERALEASERDLSMIINTMPALAWSARPDGSAEFFNQRWLDHTGLSMEQSRGWGWMSAIHPDDVHTISNYCRSTLASGEAAAVEARICHVDGSYRWFLFRTDPLRNEAGDVVKWYGTITDIEDHKRLEEALRANELSWRQIVDNIPGFVHALSATGEVEFINRQTLEYFGKTNEELKDWSRLDIVHPDDLPRAIEALTAAIRSGESYEIEHRCRRADGVYRWFQVRGRPARDTEGKVTTWYFLITDIDDRKRVEEALRASEFNARMIVDGIPGLVARVSQTGEVEIVNRPLLEYFGKDLEEVRNWAITDAIYPDDLPLALETFSKLNTGQPFDVEHRLRRFDGVYRWFQSRGLPLRDPEGRILNWYVLLTDIGSHARGLR